MNKNLICGLGQRPGGADYFGAAAQGSFRDGTTGVQVAVDAPRASLNLEVDLGRGIASLRSNELGKGCGQTASMSLPELIRYCRCVWEEATASRPVRAQAVTGETMADRGAQAEVLQLERIMKDCAHTLRTMEDVKREPILNVADRLESAHR
jgi:hypothetical protein